MDHLHALLDGPRARDAFVLRCVMRPPWSLRVLDRAPLTLLTVAAGEAWLSPADGAPVRIGVGDVAIARGPDPYTVADDPSTPVALEVHPGQVCRTVGGQSVAESMSLGVRSWGNDLDGPTVMLLGTYEQSGDISARLLRALPPLITLSAAEWESPLASVLCDELLRDDPGQGAVLDRLLDVVMVSALRRWFDRAEAQAPSWYRAQSDAVVGAAVRLMHDHPGEPWTVASLASTVGSSRAAFARRFHELIGEPPMAYLTELRLSLAADLLYEPGATVTSVAAQVGYGSPFALSNAFKRERGISPTEHRNRLVG